MSPYKALAYGACVLLAAALVGLFVASPGTAAASGGCVGSVCTVSDSTITDFSKGSFYLTGLRNTEDG